mmetsp:Transcript_2222/g.6752  ORF Transcript_2222/g.6752 Transcript_2222/m.6752 type:complete len:85 (-) Transcript_2222:44-298(-)
MMLASPIITCICNLVSLKMFHVISSFCSTCCLVVMVSHGYFSSPLGILLTLSLSLSQLGTHKRAKAKREQCHSMLRAAQRKAAK